MERLQSRLQVGFVPFVLPGPGMDDDAARKRALSGFIAQNKMIAAQSHDWLSQSNLTIGRGFRFYLLLSVQDDDLCQPFRRAQVNTNSLMVFDSFSGGRPYFDKGVETIR